MVYIDDLIGKYIYDAGNPMLRIGRRKIVPLEVRVPVKVIARLGHAQKPVDGFQSPMGLTVIIMDAEGRRMRNKDVQCAPVVHSVQDKAREQLKSPQVGFSLGILVRPIRAVLDAPAKAADQKLFIARQFQVQVGAAFHMRQVILGVVGRVVVSRHIHQRDIQKSEQVFKIGIGQVAASHDQFNISEMTVCAQTVEPFNHFIANRQDFHNGRIVPQNKLPCKVLFQAGFTVQARN